MNVYDFDKTIYDGDSSVDFYLFSLSKNKKIILKLPTQIIGFLAYKLKIKNKEYFKESFFSFLKSIEDPNSYVDMFWAKNINKITEWYLTQNKKTDVIISASPLFLLKPLEKKLKIKKVIASEVDINTGKFNSKNCYGKEKINFFQKNFNLNEIDKFYSDSLSDTPLLERAKEGYLVNNKRKTITFYK